MFTTRRSGCSGGSCHLVHSAEGEVGVPHASTSTGIHVGDVFTRSLASTFRCPHAAELRLVEGAHAVHFSSGSGTSGDAAVPVGFTNISAHGRVHSAASRVQVVITTAVACATNGVGRPVARTSTGVDEPILIGTKARSLGGLSRTNRSALHSFSVPPAVMPGGTVILGVSAVARGDTADVIPLTFIARRTVTFSFSGRARLFRASHGCGVPLASVVGGAHLFFRDTFLSRHHHIVATVDTHHVGTNSTELTVVVSSARLGISAEDGAVGGVADHGVGVPGTGGIGNAVVGIVNSSAIHAASTVGPRARSQHATGVHGGGEVTAFLAVLPRCFTSEDLAVVRSTFTRTRGDGQR